MEAIFVASPSITLPNSKTPNFGLGYQKIWRHGIRTRISGRPMQARCFSREEEKSQIKQNVLMVSKIAVTLTIVSFGLTQQPAVAEVVDKKKKKVAKQVEVMLPEERKVWTEGLPVVEERISYTDILKLKAEGKLKYIIKHPKSAPKARPEFIFAVLDDERVVRTMLPVPPRDVNFWNEWDKLGLDSTIMNAYTPPLPKPDIPSPALRFLGKYIKLIPEKVAYSMKAISQISQRKRVRRRRRTKEDPQLLEIQRQKMEMERQREELEYREEMEARTLMLKKKTVERRKRAELERRKKKEKNTETAEEVEGFKLIWSETFVAVAEDAGLQYFLGFVFFALFYGVFILSYKKRRKDYGDRQKILEVEEDERRKMAEMEEEMNASIYTSRFGQGDGTTNEAAEQNEQLKMSLQFLRSGARLRRPRGPGRPTKFMEKHLDVKFSDVAGMGDIRKELEEIVDFFKYGEMYRRRGTKIPSGILLIGEPGTGKTLLAKAVAGEAGVNFFSISASQFVEIYVGVGAARVRGLYQEAKENAPAVVFIDELDAVGRRRGMVKGSGGQERDATVNQLLTCLDGFEGKGEVITIAATNRPDVLDPALVRPGRFDRKIKIPKPSFLGRIEILKLHARKKPMADDVDYEALSMLTEGMAGADLANVLDRAALNMKRDGRSEITTDDVINAIDVEETGIHVEHNRSMDLLKKLALNEAALLVAHLNSADLKDVQAVSIAPRAQEYKGRGRLRMDMTKFELPSISRQTMLDYITAQLAPRAADEIWNGPDQFCTIWADTFNNARRAARELVFAGLSDNKEMYGLYDCWYEVDRINEIDVEALKILTMCYECSKRVLHQNQKLMDVLVDGLIAKETLDKNEIAQLVDKYGHFDPMAPPLIDIRNARLEEFQEKMMTERHILNPR